MGGGDRRLRRSADGEQRDALGARSVRSLLDAHRRLIEATTPTVALLAPGEFPGLGTLAECWLEVRGEFDALDQTRQRLGFEEAAGMALGVTGDWQAHFLMDRGRPLPAGRETCPRTLALLEGIDGVESAYFSVMGPGTELAPHSGVNKSILRVHLTLRTPEPIGAAALRVGDTLVHHRPGVAFVFDDTVEHEAWNRGATERVTLMIDVRRSLPAWLRPVDALAQAAYLHHPIRRRAAGRLQEIEAARNG